MWQPEKMKVRLTASKTETDDVKSYRGGVIEELLVSGHG